MRSATRTDEIVVVVHDTGLAWVEQTARAIRKSGCRVGVVTGATSSGELAGLRSHVDLVVTVDDPTNVGEVADAARRLGTGDRIGAVLTGNDGCVVAATAAAGQLGVGRLPSGAIARARDKYAARLALRDAGLPVPRFALFRNREEAATIGRLVGFPAIVKPVNGTGSHLVLEVSSEAELSDAYRTLAERLPAAGIGHLYSTPLPDSEGRAPAKDPQRTFLVESRLSGREFCVDVIVRDGTIEQLPLVEKPLVDERFFELAFVTPPFDLPSCREKRVRAAVDGAVRAIGLNNTVAHVEVIDDEVLGPTIVEINAGRPGGPNSHTLYRLTTGIDMAAELVAVCRSAPSVRRRPMLPMQLASLSLFTEKPGRLRAVHGIERMKAHPDVLEVVQVRQPGDLISQERETQVLLVICAGFFDADDLGATFHELKRMMSVELDRPNARHGNRRTPL